MKQNHKNVLKFIAAVNRLGPYMQTIGTSGSCWRFHQLLATVFPAAEPYYLYDDENSHVISKIGKRYYDVTGEITKNVCRFKPFDETHWPGCTKYRERWWCRFRTIAESYEKAVMKQAKDKDFKY